MRVTSSKEIPQPPPRMPVSFHLDLDEDEALILVEVMGSIGGENTAFRQKLSLMWEELQGEIDRQKGVIRPQLERRAYRAAAELRARDLYPREELFINVGRFDKG